MAQVSLTNEQIAASTVRGRPVLVSAAAGSGKTFVLVQRLMNAICSDSNAADITDFLIITYTRAAAEELRIKIQKELEKRIIEAESSAPAASRHLRRQVLLLPQAHIGTIHSYCASLLRENAQILHISPSFRVMDETESEKYRLMAMDSMLEQSYQEIESDEAFRALADYLVKGKGDGELQTAVKDLYDHLLSLPDINQWIEAGRSGRLALNCEDLSDTIWGKRLMKHTEEVTEWCFEGLNGIVESLSAEKKAAKWVAGIKTLIDALDRLREALTNQWDDVCNQADLIFPIARAGGREDYLTEKTVFRTCKEMLQNELMIYGKKSSDYIRDIQSSSIVIRGLYDAVFRYRKEYENRKERSSKLDYSDLEHLALKLLWDFPAGAASVSKVAQHISGRYREVMVDEYQDVNQIQEMILFAVSNEGRKRFMVGDMKQSIYRFRMADVSIFKDKYLSYKTYEGISGEEPVKIILPDNFRSSRGVVDGVNAVFAHIMSEQLGELSYGENEMLRFHRSCPDDGRCNSEIMIIPDMRGRDAGENPVPSVLYEARMVAQRIKSMVISGECVWEKQNGSEIDVKRRLSYQDFAVLLRSMKGCEEYYLQAFTEYDIPVCRFSGNPWFQTMEAELMMDYLSIVDNPEQDISLLHVLTSPLYAFSYEELAQFRIQSPGISLYHVLERCSYYNTHCFEFLSELKELRAIAPNMTASDFLIHLIVRTKAVALLNAASYSSDVEENLMHLLQYSVEFDDDGDRSVFRFVNHIRWLWEHEKKPAGLTGEQGKGVHLLTIHKSKGLEYPVVFLGATAHGFNLQDTRSPVLFHRELGLGLMIRNRQTMMQRPTIARIAIGATIKQEAISEEMRVLYVALTRARDRLIVPVCVNTNSKKENEFLESLRFMPQYLSSPLVLSRFSDYKHWMLCAVFQNPRVRESVESFSHAVDAYPWKYTVCENTRGVNDAENCTAEIGEGFHAEDGTEENRGLNGDIIKKWLDWSYPYQLQTILPSKVTATELKGLPEYDEAADQAQHLNRQCVNDISVAGKSKKKKSRKPDFTGGNGSLSGSERGTAMHMAMQYLDFTHCTTDEALALELDRLVGKEFLSNAQAEAIDRGQILSLFRSELGKMLISVEKSRINREFKFSLLVPAKELDIGDVSDSVLFQGVVDCWIDTPDGIIIVDFKTDHINDTNYTSKVDDYSKQINLYALALERITGKEVTDGIIYFFSINRAVSVMKKRKK